MKYRVDLTFMEPYAVVVEAKDFEQAKRKARLKAFEETFRTGSEYEDVEIRIDNVREVE